MPARKPGQTLNDDSTFRRPVSIMSPHYQGDDIIPILNSHRYIDWVSTGNPFQSSSPDPMTHMTEIDEAPYMEAGGGDEMPWGVDFFDPRHEGDT